MRGKGRQFKNKHVFSQKQVRSYIVLALVRTYGMALHSLGLFQLVLTFELQQFFIAKNVLNIDKRPLHFVHPTSS